MNFSLNEDTFFKEVDNTSLKKVSIIGCWRKHIKFGSEFAQYTEAETMEFNTDGTGGWKQWDNSGYFKPCDDPFTYRIQGRRIIISYESSPDQYHTSDFRVADGHLVLIENYGMPGEDIEVYDLFSTSNSK